MQPKPGDRFVDKHGVMWFYQAVTDTWQPLPANMRQMTYDLAAAAMNETMISLTWGWALKNNDTITFTGKALSLP